MSETNNIANPFGEDEYEDFDIMTITTEDGEEVECAIIDTFAVRDRDYIAIIALKDIEDENSNVLLYELEVLEDGQPKLNVINDDVFEEVVETFEEIMKEMDGELEQ